MFDFMSYSDFTVSPIPFLLLFKELSDWYVQYADQLERLRATNR